MSDEIRVIVVGDAPTARLASDFILAACQLVTVYTSENASERSGARLRVQSATKQSGRDCAVDDTFVVPCEHRKKFSDQLRDTARRLMGDAADEVLITEGTNVTYLQAHIFLTGVRQRTATLNRIIEAAQPKH